MPRMLKLEAPLRSGWLPTSTPGSLRVRSMMLVTRLRSISFSVVTVTVVVVSFSARSVRVADTTTTAEGISSFLGFAGLSVAFFGAGSAGWGSGLEPCN